MTAVPIARERYLFDMPTCAETILPFTILPSFRTPIRKFDLWKRIVDRTPDSALPVPLVPWGIDRPGLRSAFFMLEGYFFFWGFVV